MPEILSTVIGLVALLVLALLVGGPLLWFKRRRYDSHLRHYAESLGAQLLKPALEGEVAQIIGTTTDGIAWQLRLIYDYHETEDECGHHLLWATDVVRLTQVRFVLGNGPDDDQLSGTWLWHSGRSPEEMKRDAAETFDRSLFSLIEQIPALTQLGPEQKTATLGKPPDQIRTGDVLASLTGSVREHLRDETRNFVESARRVQLPPSLASVYHAFTIDDGLAASLLAPPVERLLRNWHDQYHHPADGYLRVWVGGPNLRIEARIQDASPEAYRHIVELGSLLARIAAQPTSSPPSA
jgi:hypothetical protein